jgi:MFS family permease
MQHAYARARPKPSSVLESTGSRNIVAYFFAFLMGESAAQILTIAVGWSVYGIHHRPFDLGLVGLAIFLPSLLLVFVTGHLVDRYDRKRIIVLAAIGQAVFTFLFAALAFAGIRDLLLYLAVLVGLGTARAFGSPAERTILVSIVATSDYMRVQARYSSLREIVVIGAPALGGALVAVSAVAAFAVAGLFVLASIAGFLRVHVPATMRAKGAALDADSALAGVRFIAARPVVMGAISLDLFAVLFGGATALLPVYADQILHVGAVGFGLLRSAGGVGASITAIVLSQRTPNRRVGRTMFVAVAGFGLATIVFAFSRTLWLSILALAATGAFDMVSVVIRRGLVQLNTPDAMRGRVNAVESVFIGASGQLGSFESGTLAQLAGPVACVALGGLATVAIVLIWAVVFPALRASDQLRAVEM